MKSPFLFILSSIFMTASLLAVEGGGEVPTTWPGVKFQVSDIKRLDNTRVLMVVRLKSDGTASEPITIGELPKETKPKSGRKPMEDGEDLPRAFSLTSARLLDETTKQEFAALPSLPRKPYFGPNAMVTTLGSGGWIQMAVCFNAPPPLPVGNDGKRPPQKVTVLFPRAAKPMTGVVLPAVAVEAAGAKP